MLERDYGASGLTVSALGFGAMQVGDPALDDAEAGRILNGVLDLGIRLIDTARSYGLAEERIGRHLARRRDQFVLSTKVGYGVDGVTDWTYEAVARGIDAARDRLATDVIDIVHLHSCSTAVLAGHGVIDALIAALDAGKVHVAAYAGDAEPLAYALADPRLGGVQASVNLCDQEALRWLPAAQARGLGVLGKRTLAGLAWRAERPPDNAPHAEYWHRFQALRRALGERDWQDLALRYAAFRPGVDACLVGGTSLAHVAANVAALEAGPLPPAEEAAVLQAYAAVGAGWRGVV